MIMPPIRDLVTIHYDHFKKYWKTKGVSGISVFVDDGSSINTVKEKIQSLETNGQQFVVRTYKFLRDSSIEIFDRTFLIAKVLQILLLLLPLSEF